ncbi:MAG: hypothetical protein Fur0021_19840 [Candidatus Promineifilaceae bacterium]
MEANLNEQSAHHFGYKSYDRETDCGRYPNHSRKVIYIAELEPGINDDVILRRANATQALLITADKDLGEMVFRQRLVHAVVLLVRLAGLLPNTKARVVAEVIRSRGSELLDSFSVISPSNVRIRKRQP